MSRQTSELMNNQMYLGAKIRQRERNRLSSKIILPETACPDWAPQQVASINSFNAVQNRWFTLIWSQRTFMTFSVHGALDSSSTLAKLSLIITLYFLCDLFCSYMHSLFFLLRRQNIQQKKPKEGRVYFWLTVDATVHHGVEGMAARVQGNWPHCVQSGSRDR